ncbi:putative (S)-norcoclaurine synthase [Helianthus annuus]|nr:putative (S)-norcoclaurine synthase [Helianthus annuus]
MHVLQLIHRLSVTKKRRQVSLPNERKQGKRKERKNLNSLLAGMATRNLGTSIPVASVKELVAQSPDAVPERYLRDVDGDCEYPTGDSSLQVPILDMTKLLHPQFHQLELQKLHHACKHWGIFQVNHQSSYFVQVQTCFSCNP